MITKERSGDHKRQQQRLQTDRQAGRQADRQTGRQTDRQTKRNSNQWKPQILLNNYRAESGKKNGAELRVFGRESDSTHVGRNVHSVNPDQMALIL